MYILATWVLHIQIFTDVMKTSAHHRIITPVCVSAVFDFSTEIRISVTLIKNPKSISILSLCVLYGELIPSEAGGQVRLVWMGES